MIRGGLFYIPLRYRIYEYTEGTMMSMGSTARRGQVNPKNPSTVITVPPKTNTQPARRCVLFQFSSLLRVQGSFTPIV